MLRQFPFHILGFHSDNGSEFINHVGGRVAQQTVDRADQVPAAALQNDNALVESKNGAVIRKHIGYGYIAGGTRSRHAVLSYPQYRNPYLNFHRPCGVPERVINDKGKEKKRYRW